jgi:hypothetical protein
MDFNVNKPKHKTNNMIMKKSTIIKQVLIAFSVVLVLSNASAQTTAPKSPAATATGTLKSGTNITIKYSSPSVRDRKIWGGLVPFDSIWRAGANDATQIEFDKAVKIDGQPLAVGKYTIYMVPTSEKCIVIFSSQTGQPGMNHDGSSTLDLTKVVLRGLAGTKKSKEFKEALIYSINKKGMVLSWENLDIILPIK